MGTGHEWSAVMSDCWNHLQTSVSYLSRAAIPGKKRRPWRTRSETPSSDTLGSPKALLRAVSILESKSLDYSLVEISALHLHRKWRVLPCFWEPWLPLSAAVPPRHIQCSLIEGRPVFQSQGGYPCLPWVLIWELGSSCSYWIVYHGKTSLVICSSLFDSSLVGMYTPVILHFWPLLRDLTWQE